MDSLTQITLGAAVGAAIAGKTHGRKAAVMGAICGTIPDLDVFIPLGDPVSDFTYHRSVTHSILFCIVMTPFLSWIFAKLRWFNISFGDKRIMAAIFLCLLTHILLDAMTIYGTQIFWPLPLPPVGIGSIFIIDPLYTLPFLIFLIAWLVWKNQKIIYCGIIISTFYLGWSVFAQQYVYNIARPQTEGQMLVQPTPFNTILWCVLVIQDDGYKVGYYSLFDESQNIEFQSFLSDKSLLNNSWAALRLQWFTKGFYAVTQDGENIIISDLRMGLEPDQYVFNFIINHDPPLMVQPKRDLSRLKDIWDRINRRHSKN